MFSHPGKIQSAIPIATTLKHTPQQIAFNEVGRQAVMSDPHWKNGDYYDLVPPSKGLAIARMIGHITYMSDTVTDGLLTKLNSLRMHLLIPN